MSWNHFRSAALALFVAALLIGFGVTALFMGRHLSRETWRIVFILALVVLTITSTILIPRVLNPNPRSPHPEFLTDDLEDEWRDLQQRRIARPHILLLGGVIAALAYLWAILYYGKLTNAIWFGWLPVGAAAIALALLLVAIVRRTPW
jgi:MFS family permease